MTKSPAYKQIDSHHLAHIALVGVHPSQSLPYSASKTSLTDWFHDAICDALTQPRAHSRLQGALFYIRRVGFLWREISEMMS